MRKKYFFFIAVLLLTISCHRHKGVPRSCGYSLGDFFSKYDSSKFIIKRYPYAQNKHSYLTEILDSTNPTGERGLYKFDSNNVLRFYGYLLDTSYNYFFGIEYDSVGNCIVPPKSKVVRWQIGIFKNDSLRVSAYLYHINYYYDSIRILTSDSIIKEVPLFESTYYSNLIVGKVVIGFPKQQQFYITGKIQDRCTGEISSFKDSILIPDELFNAKR